MKTIQVGKFKSEFSSILQSIQEEGDGYIIEFGKKRKKVAVLIPYSKHIDNKSPREFGILENGGFTLHDDFELTEEEFLGG